MTQRQVLFLGSDRDEPVRLVLERKGSRCRIAAGERVDLLDAARLPDGRLSLLFEDGRQLCGRAGAARPDGVQVVAAGRALRVPIARTRPARAGSPPETDAGGVEQVRALMHGRIVEVRVAPGDRVEAGSLLLVLEAMKMQNEIRASRPGVVERAEVSPGQAVEGGALLVSIRSENGGQVI